MKPHPMDVNINTRIRWDVIARMPEVRRITGKRVLDIGAGLGFFSVKFAERDAQVVAVDADAESLKYLQNQYRISTLLLNVESDPFPEGPFDVVMLGEIMEHVHDPLPVLRKAHDILAPEGILILTTPALEGLLTNTRGKSLGHDSGTEKHERNGYFRHELTELLDKSGMKVCRHFYSVFLLAELFMQLTKLVFLRRKHEYQGQVDVVKQIQRPSYRLLAALFPLPLFVFKCEQRIRELLPLPGHCHIIAAARS